MRIGFDFTKEEKEIISNAIRKDVLRNLGLGDTLIIGKDIENNETTVRVEKKNKPKYEWHMLPELPKTGQPVMIFMAKYDITSIAKLCKRRSRPRWYFHTCPKSGEANAFDFSLEEVTMWKEFDPGWKFPEDMDK